jgi:hypothetical protein
MFSANAGPEWLLFIEMDGTRLRGALHSAAPHRQFVDSGVTVPMRRRIIP